jgi:hypothetical protein
MEITCLYEAESPEILEGLKVLTLSKELKVLTFSKGTSGILKPNPLQTLIRTVACTR